MVDIVEQLPSIPPARGSPIEQWDTELVVFASQVDLNQGTRWAIRHNIFAI